MRTVHIESVASASGNLFVITDIDFGYSVTRGGGRLRTHRVKVLLEHIKMFAKF